MFIYECFHNDLFTFDNQVLKLEVAVKYLLKAMSQVKQNDIPVSHIALQHMHAAIAYAKHKGSS